MAKPKITYAANTDSDNKEIHKLSDGAPVSGACQIGEITEKHYLVVKNLATVKALIKHEGFDRCAKCFGREASDK